MQLLPDPCVPRDGEARRVQLTELLVAGGAAAVAGFAIGQTDIWLQRLEGGTDGRARTADLLIHNQAL